MNLTCKLTTMKQVVDGTLLKMLMLVLIPVGQVERRKTKKLKITMAGNLITPRTTRTLHQMDGVNERRLR